MSVYLNFIPYPITSCIFIYTILLENNEKYNLNKSHPNSIPTEVSHSLYQIIEKYLKINGYFSLSSQQIQPKYEIYNLEKYLSVHVISKKTRQKYIFLFEKGSKEKIREDSYLQSKISLDVDREYLDYLPCDFSNNNEFPLLFYRDNANKQPTKLKEKKENEENVFLLLRSVLLIDNKKAEEKLLMSMNKIYNIFSIYKSVYDYIFSYEVTRIYPNLSLYTENIQIKEVSSHKQQSKLVGIKNFLLSIKNYIHYHLFTFSKLTYYYAYRINIGLSTNKKYRNENNFISNSYLKIVNKANELYNQIEEISTSYTILGKDERLINKNENDNISVDESQEVYHVNSNNSHLNLYGTYISYHFTPFISRELNSTQYSLSYLNDNPHTHPSYDIWDTHPSYLDNDKIYPSIFLTYEFPSYKSFVDILHTKNIFSNMKISYKLLYNNDSKYHNLNNDFSSYSNYNNITYRNLRNVVIIFTILLSFIYERKLGFFREGTIRSSVNEINLMINSAYKSEYSKRVFKNEPVFSPFVYYKRLGFMSGFRKETFICLRSMKEKINVKIEKIDD